MEAKTLEQHILIQDIRKEILEEFYRKGMVNHVHVACHFEGRIYEAFNEEVYPNDLTRDMKKEILMNPPKQRPLEKLDYWWIRNGKGITLIIVFILSSIILNYFFGTSGGSSSPYYDPPLN